MALQNPFRIFIAVVGLLFGFVGCSSSSPSKAELKEVLKQRHPEWEITAVDVIDQKPLERIINVKFEEKGNSKPFGVATITLVKTASGNWKVVDELIAQSEVKQ